MSPWKLYNDLIGGIPDGITLSDCNTGYNWTSVMSSEGGTGIAKTIPVYSLPYSFKGELIGAPLRKVAELSKSWNFIEAAIGVAAIGAYYNLPARARGVGAVHPRAEGENQNVFDIYLEEIAGKKVAVVGHFPKLEQKLGTICDLTILEREPQFGDLPDSACEYVLSEQDYVFMTACTLVNKTMPRLLKLSENAKTVIAGPSTIITPIMFEYGAYGLSGMMVLDSQRCDTLIRGGNAPALFDAGEMVNPIRPSK